MSNDQPQSFCLKPNCASYSNSVNTRARTPALALLLASALLVASVALALGSDTLPTGEFEDVDGEGGYLVISSVDHNKLAFELVANGANLHSCSLSGSIEGNRGRTGTEHGQSICIVDFHALPNAITVQVDGAEGNFEACRAFCGVRASFDRTYAKPPVGCTGPERRAIYSKFAQADHAKEYSRALGELDRVQADCAPFFDWKERDAVHNHRALTLHHLHRNGECMSELDDTLAFSADNEAALREHFSGEPMKFEAYLPTARTTWEARRLCSGREQEAP